MAGRTRLGRLAPLTTHVFNPVMRLIAGRVPGLGMLTHTGRTSGRAYPTPVLVFRSGDEFAQLQTPEDLLKLPPQRLQALRIGVFGRSPGERAQGL